MGSGLREFDEQGLQGYRLLQYHWKQNVTNGAVRRLVEGRPGSDKGLLWSVLYGLFFELVPIFDQRFQMEKPKFNGDVSNLSRDIRTYCLLQRKQGFEGHTQLSMVEMFLQRLLKTTLYAHKADEVLRHLRLQFPDHQFADLASDGVRAKGKSQDVLDKENNLREEFRMDTLVSRWTSFSSRRERSDRT